MNSRLSYDQWNAILGEAFFNSGRAGDPVFFFIDEEVVEELAARQGDDRGLASLVEPVQAKRGHWDLFDQVVREAARWRLEGKTGFPPTLPILAVSVIAATQMAASGSIGSNNYYVRFRRLLGLPEGGGKPSGFQSSVTLFWKDLIVWLNEDMEGALGLLTPPPVSWHVNIGYPISQALWRDSDTQRLDDLLDRIDADRYDNVDRVLTQVRRQAEGFRQNAQLFLKDPVHEPSVLRLLHSRLSASRTPVEAPARGVARRTPEIAHVHVGVKAGLRRDLRLFAMVREGWPRAITVVGTGGAASLEASDSGFLPLAVRPSSSLLDAGIELDVTNVEDARVVLEPSPAYILAEDSDHGGWSTAVRPAPTALVLLLVPTSGPGSPSAIPALADIAEVRDVSTPDGWTLRGPITAQAAAALLPSLPERRAQPTALELWGGLRLPIGVRRFLTGEEPQVVIPIDEIHRGRVTVLVNGGERPLPVVDGAAPLESLRLPPGRHRVEVGSGAVTIVTMPGVGNAIAEGTGSVHHALHRRAGELQPSRLGATAADDAHDIAVAGARVEPAELLPQPRRPACFRRDADHVLLLGAEPGQIHRPSRTARPHWVGRLGFEGGGGLLDDEADTPFDVVWVIETLRGSTRARLAQEREPVRVTGNRPSTEAEGWARALLGAAPPRAGSDLWERYQDLARGIADVS